jgi:hypothetical protein
VKSRNILDSITSLRKLDCIFRPAMKVLDFPVKESNVDVKSINLIWLSKDTMR